jgi:hypothetical protein
MATRVEAIAETALQLLFHADNLTASKIKEIASAVEQFATNIQTEIDRVRQFKIDVHWKSRVINPPKAIENFKEIIHELTIGLKAKLFDIAQPFKDFEEGLKLLSNLPADPGVARISTAFNEVENFIAALNTLVGDIATAIEAASDITQLFDRVLQDIEHLDDLFLPQTSVRKKVTETYFKRNV